MQKIIENEFITQKLQKKNSWTCKRWYWKGKTISVNYIGLIPLITKAIKEQHKTIDTKKEINSFSKLLEQ